jgi:hypothetical protein
VSPSTNMQQTHQEFCQLEYFPGTSGQPGTRTPTWFSQFAQRYELVRNFNEHVLRTHWILIWFAWFVCSCRSQKALVVLYCCGVVHCCRCFGRKRHAIKIYSRKDRRLEPGFRPRLPTQDIGLNFWVLGLASLAKEPKFFANNPSYWQTRSYINYWRGFLAIWRAKRT